MHLDVTDLMVLNVEMRQKSRLVAALLLLIALIAWCAFLNVPCRYRAVAVAWPCPLLTNALLNLRTSFPYIRSATTSALLCWRLGEIMTALRRPLCGLVNKTWLFPLTAALFT